MTLYSYSGTQTIVQSGDPGGTWAAKVNWTPSGGPFNIADGTQTTTTLGSWGETYSVAVADLLSTLPLGEDDYTYTDNLNRSYFVVHPDGRTETFNYACCGLDTYVDRDGTTNQYFYDAAKRQIASLRLGILTSNVLDAAGNVRKTVRFGTDGSPVVLGQTAYDLAGRVIFETNALNGVTSHSETYGSNGRTVSTTFPDTGTRVELYNQDGSLQSVTGTAAFPVYYQYGYDAATGSPYTLETKGSSTGSEWTETYTDMLRRAYKTVYASAAGNPSLARYNAQGQLTNQVDPDQVSLLFAYNAKGEQTYSIVDSNRNYQIDWSGATADRITLVTNDVVNDIGPVARRTRTFVWADSSNTPTLVSTEETSADSLNSWTIVYRDASTPVTNWSQTTYGANGARTVTTTAPDNSYTISTYQYGRLASVTRYDSLNSQLSTINYSYDPHGRQSTATDARNGTTTWTYQTTPTCSAPSPPRTPARLEAPRQTTITYYNPMLQATNVVQPDGTSVTSEFYPTGQLKRQYGSRTYPVGYGYDYAGRVLTMTNWTSLPRHRRKGHDLELQPLPRLARQQDLRRRHCRAVVHVHACRALADPHLGAQHHHHLHLRRCRRTGDASATATGTTPGVTYTYDRRGPPGHRHPEWHPGHADLQRRQLAAQRVLHRRPARRPLRHQRLRPVPPPHQPGPQHSNTPLSRPSLRLRQRLPPPNRHRQHQRNTPYSATYSYLANSPLVSKLSSNRARRRA